MRQTHEESRYHRLQSNPFQLGYQPNEAEGECIIHSVVPVRFVPWRFALYILLNGFIFIPLLLTYWNDNFKRIFYMRFCPLEHATHLYILNYDGQVSIVPKQQKYFLYAQAERRYHSYFVNRYMTYIIDEQRTVKLWTYLYHERVRTIADPTINELGLSTQMALGLRESYGPGTMVIRKPSIIELIIFQVIKPLYIFLLFSVAFWTFAEQYYYFATTLFVVFVVGVVINLFQMVELNNKIFAMAYYEIRVNVLRNGEVFSLSSFEVVPGDIVFLKDPIKLPFEGLILEGSALINQCALTGESVPVVKKADRLDRLAADPTNIDKNAFVFEGTTIVQVSDQKRMVKFEQYRERYGIPVCVVRTNFITTKGQLIRIILFPKEQENSFQRESTKFLFFLFVIAIGSYVGIIVVNFDYEDTTDIIIKLIDIILIAVPPALPVSMTFGIIYALERLNKKRIFCISQNKVITGGIIEFCCFDKTGTLTEDYMDFYCIVPAHAGKFHTQVANTEEMSRYMIDNVKTKPYYLPALNNMAANHSIIKIEATGELIGDPMEIKAFQFGQFRLNQAQSDQEAIFSFESDRKHNGSVIRRYEFQSELQRMSVVARTSLTEGCQVLAKGSPEMMLTIMKKNSIPKNYNDILKEYASHGFRVLAIASKPITEEELHTFNRAEMQTGLIFNGFEVYQNPLKKQTSQAIRQLKDAKIDCVMITGDNTLTGSNISYKCSISDRSKQMIIVDWDGTRLTEEQFIFHDYDNARAFPTDKPIAESYIEDDVRNSLLSRERSSSRGHSSLRDKSELDGFEPNKDNNEEFMFNLAIKAEETNCQLCVTGKAFNQFFSGSVDNISVVQRSFMEKATVFARTKPNDKAKIVMVFQQMGKKVSMCGDGANDCGALKQADIGLSLSQAEASISAPFTSQVTNISSMVELIKECRAGLATNFSLFNIMAVYSLIQYTSSLVCEYYLQYPADFQYLYWDICLNFFLILFIGYTGTADRLSVQRPRNSLFSLTNTLQIVIMFLLQFAGQICAILLFQQTDPTYYSDYGGIEKGRQNYDDTGDFGLDGVEGNAVFIFTNNIYLVSVLAFNISAPWRKEVYTNFPLILVTLLAFAYNTLIAVLPAVRLGLFQLDNMPSENNVGLVIYLGSLGLSFFLYINQKYILEPLSEKLVKAYPKAKWL